jgi:hypothetical protein
MVVIRPDPNVTLRAKEIGDVVININQTSNGTTYTTG